MKNNNSPFNQVLLLTGARIFGVLFSIVIPMYLGRKLSVETYGTYKQIMLFFWFAQVALNLGLDDSAYFYLRWEPKKFSLYSFNALVFNLFATGVLWALMTTFSHQIAALLNNASLENYLPLLGYLTLATVSSMQIEGILIGMNRLNERLVIEMGIEILKSMAIIGAFYFFNSLKVVLILLSTLMTVRLLITVTTILSYKKKEGLKLREAPSLMMSQLKFGLPLGLSRILQNILNIENYFISSFFSLAQFTYYTVGCFENPLVNATRTSMYEIINIEMIDALKHKGTSYAVHIWKEMSRKLFLIIIPMVVFMIFFGKEIIVFIFSEKYLPSVSFFMIFNLYLIVGALNPEPLFRANSKTHVALKIKIVGLAIGVLLFVLGAWLGGALWALVGKIVGVLFMNIIGLNQGAKLLESKFIDLFAWSDLTISTLISIFVAGFLKLAFLFVAWKPFWILAFSFTLFTGFYFFLSYLSKIIKEEELYLIKKTLFQKILRVNAL